MSFVYGKEMVPMFEGDGEAEKSYVAYLVLRSSTLPETAYRHYKMVKKGSKTFVSTNMDVIDDDTEKVYIFSEMIPRIVRDMDSLGIELEGGRSGLIARYVAEFIPALSREAVLEYLETVCQVDIILNNGSRTYAGLGVIVDAKTEEFKRFLPIGEFSRAFNDGYELLINKIVGGKLRESYKEFGKELNPKFKIDYEKFSRLLKESGLVYTESGQAAIAQLVEWSNSFELR